MQGVARPVPLMLAMLLEEELQVTLELRSFDVPSLYLPVAVNCCVAPKAMVGSEGVTVDVKVTFGRWRGARWNYLLASLKVIPSKRLQLTKTQA